MNSEAVDACVVLGGAVVVVAKCPIAGVSKTRLATLLGVEGAAQFAQAMLSDVLVSLSECSLLRSTLKVLLYAPGTESGALCMGSILHSLNLSWVNSSSETLLSGKHTSEWILLPMKPSDHDLTSSSLGDKLSDALERTRELMRIVILKSCETSTTNEAVLFLGMDAPELPMDEVVRGLQIASGDQTYITTPDPTTTTKEISGKAHLCPAVDGGYAILSIPKHAPSSAVFAGVRWSQPLTAISQLKALTDSNVNVSIGKLMYDVDEPSDVYELVKRLRQSKYAPLIQTNSYEMRDVLTQLSTGSGPAGLVGLRQSFPRHTWKVLVDMKFIHDNDAS